MIIPIIIYNILLIIVSIVSPSETPNFFGIKTYIIISRSMEPNLNIGDIVFVKKCEEENLKNNDIISFREGQFVITHRIVEIKENENGKEYVTKGDNNKIKDEVTVKYCDIEGVYIGKVAYIGNIVLFLKNKIVIILIILIVYLIYLHDIKVIKKEKIRKRKREKFESELKDKS